MLKDLLKAAMSLKASILVVILVGMTAAMEHFLDCPGNRPSFFMRFVRRCCENEPQLPNNCECFSIERASGFTNIFLHRPKCPKDIGVRFLLYTQDKRNSYEIIKVSDDSIGRSHFRSQKPVKIISHGFQGKAPEKWNLAMKDAILDKEDANVILVDWRKGAKLTIKVYTQPAANVRSVGAMVARLIQVLVFNHGADFKNVHLIGHSLGAHVSGMAGKEIKRLTGLLVGRVSGLDPAGLFFEKSKRHVRLDKDDAVFVDVIHTDAEPLGKSGFGIRKQIGYVDFWPNGGVHQPSCPKEFLFFSLFQFKDGENVGTCSHGRVEDYFTNSINRCSYHAGGGCRMGYHADKKFCQGNKYFKTKDEDEPYC